MNKMHYNPHFYMACEFLKSKFNGEIQRLYGADECAKLLAEYGNRQFNKGVESTYTGGKKLEERILNAWTTRIGIDKAEMARIAASIVLEVAEKSYLKGFGDCDKCWEPDFEEFKKELLG